jgi:hypothetical protein
MRRRELLGTLLGSLLAACGESPPVARVPNLPRSRTRSEARRRLSELGRTYELLMGEHGRHQHARYAGTLKEGASTRAAMAKLRAEEQDVFREAAEIVKRFGVGIVSPRRLDLWQKGALGLELLSDPRSAELSDELEAVVDAHQLVLDGHPLTRADLMQMQLSSDARVRRDVRRVVHQLHVKAAPVAAALIARRREVAKEKRLPSFWSALLEARGGDVQTLERIFNELSRRSYRSYVEALTPMIHARGRLAWSRQLVLPWDLEFRVARAAPVRDERFPAERAFDTAERIFGALGFDLAAHGLDIRQRDFAFGGQTIAVHVPDDVRLVVRPMPGPRYYAVLLHELGHAVAAISTRTTEPLFKGYEWVPGLVDPACAEGVAEVFAQLLDEPRVLREMVGLDDADTQATLRARRLGALVRLRKTMVAVSFERVALERPNANLDALSLDVERRHSGTVVPRDTEPVWAASPFLASYPVYQHAYTLAAVMAVQVKAALTQRFGPDYLSPRAGAWLRDGLMADGARWTLREKLVRTVGAPLDPVPMLRYLNQPV